MNKGLKLLIDRTKLAPEEFLNGEWGWVFSAQYMKLFPPEDWETFENAFKEIALEKFTLLVAKQIMASADNPQQLELDL